MTNQMPVNVNCTNIFAINDSCTSMNNNEIDLTTRTIKSLTAKVHNTTNGDDYCCPQSSSCNVSSSIPKQHQQQQQQPLSSFVPSIPIQERNVHTNEEGDDYDIKEKEIVSNEQQQILLPPSELIALFEDFMHFGNVGLHIVNDKGIIVWANQAELDLLGYTKEEYIGQPIKMIHNNIDCLSHMLTTLMSGNEVINHIAPLKTKDGRIEYVQINSSMRLVNGQKTTTRCFSAVVTDRVLREQAIMEANAQKCEATISKEQMERKTIFLRRLCHELRNPLQGIKGNLDLLLEELQDLKKQVAETNGNNNNKTTTFGNNRMGAMNSKENNNDLLDIQHQLEQRIDNALEYAEYAYLATEHQMLVINETLSLARLESEQDGLESFNLKSVEMCNIIREVHAIMGVKAFEKGIDVQYHIVSDDAKHIRTDPCWLKQILINLISNAIKFTLEGRIVITIDTCQYNNATKINDNNNNNKSTKCCNNSNKKIFNNNIALKVTIKDDGIGMTVIEQQKLFGVFAQANDNIATEYGGSGLGLNIIQQMLGHIDGSIEIIESIKDIGSTFQFIMPCEIINHNDDEVKKNNFLNNHEANNNVSSLLEEDAQQKSVSEIAKATATSTRSDVAVSYAATTLEAATFAAYSGIKHQSVSCDETKKLTFKPHVKETARIAINNSNNKNKDNVRILIVDDSPMNLKILSNFLRKNGYTKHEMAHHGKEAYEMHQKNPFDLIMTDIDMPYMDGLELTKQIRNREKKQLLDDSSDRLTRKVVPIIGISGNVLPEDSALATEVGMNEYVGKPYRFPVIEALIEKHIFETDDISLS